MYGYDWCNHGLGNESLFLRTFKQRNSDFDINVRQGDVRSMDILTIYKMFKTNFGCERLMNEILIRSYIKVLVTFRGGF